MAVWPVELPQALQLGFAEERQPNVIRTQTDTGPAKLRRRATAAVVAVSGQLHVSDAQLTVLETFFRTTLLDGSLTFDWEMPSTGVAAVCRFMAPPRKIGVSKGATQVSIEIEVLP